MSRIDKPSFPDLDEHILNPDPIRQFLEWYDAVVVAGIPQYDAMSLATSSADGIPSARMVLLKQVDEKGFVFYTNYQSRKGRDISSNPRAALVFFWADLNRSVRIEGDVSKVSEKESDAYFATRPRDSQLSSLTSSQGEVVKSRDVLDENFVRMKRDTEGKTLSRPMHWGGYRLKPVRIEFWQARFARLNDRIEYILHTDGRWKMQRLQP